MKNNSWKILCCTIVMALIGIGIGGCGPSTSTTVAPVTTEITAPTAPVAPVVPTDTSLPPTPTAAPPKVLTIAIPNQYSDTFDIAAQIYAMEPTQMIYDGLVTMDWDYHIQPGLAESWDVSEDGKQVTFHLKQGVKFTDGSPFNAEVVKWWVELMISDVSTVAYMYKSIKEVEVIDDYTAIFHLEKPYPALFWYLSGAWGLIMSKQAYESEGADYPTHPVGSGPFILKEWVQNDHLTLVKNPDYNWAPAWTGHTGPANIDTIIYRIIPEDATRLVELEAGNVDLLLDAPWREIPTYQENPDYQVISTPDATIYFIGMNVIEPLVADLRTRQAIGYAIDRDLIKDTFFIGLGEAKTTYLASQMASDKGVAAVAPSYDPEKAAELLKEAGWEMGNDGILVAKNVTGVPAGTKFEVSYWTYNEDEAKRLAEATQKMLSDIGIKANIELMDKSTYDGKLEAGGCQVILRKYTWDGEDILPWFHAAYNLPYPNYLNVNDPALDKMFDDSEYAVATWDEREASFTEAHKYLIQTWYPWAPFYQRPAVWIAHSYVDISTVSLRAGMSTEVWSTADINK
jgi:peptide/nickel transport system substrate-binding protein